MRFMSSSVGIRVNSLKNHHFLQQQQRQQKSKNVNSHCLLICHDDTVTTLKLNPVKSAAWQ